MAAAGKRAFWRTVALLMIGSVIQYALFHVANLSRFDAAGEILSYVTYYYDRVWEFLFPALSAVIMLISYAYDGRRSALTAGVAYAATRALYYIPLGYIMAIGYGYDSFESLLGGLLIALAMGAVVYLESLLCVLLALLPAYLAAKRSNATVNEIIRAGLEHHDSLDLSSQGTAAVGITVLIQFLKLLAIEINDTVEFFTSGKFYTTGEVFYIVFKYCFAIMLLAGAHFLLCFVKKRNVGARVCEAASIAKTEKGEK